MITHWPHTEFHANSLSLAHWRYSQCRSILWRLPCSSIDPLPVLNLEGLVIFQDSSAQTTLHPNSGHRSVHWHAWRPAYTHLWWQRWRGRAPQVNCWDRRREKEEVVWLSKGGCYCFVLGNQSSFTLGNTSQWWVDACYCTRSRGTWMSICSSSKMKEVA